MSTATIIELGSTSHDVDAIASHGTPPTRHASPHPSVSRVFGQGGEVHTPHQSSPDLSISRSVVIISVLTCITAMTSMSTGILTVGLPTIAEDVGLPQDLLLWPASIFAYVYQISEEEYQEWWTWVTSIRLTSGCSLLLAGSVADVVGNRKIYLTGCALLAAFVFALGFARSGVELIAFRGLQGVALSLCLPTAVSIVTQSFPEGQRRNVGFSFLGAGQVLGFCVGLVLGGLLIESVGWRVAFYICGAVHVVALALAFWVLPEDRTREAISARRLRYDIDWVGTVVASSCLGMLSYVLAVITGSSSSIREPINATLLTMAAVLVPVFVFWVGRQERLGKPALIPNSLWKIPAFTAVCFMVMLSWGVMNSMEFFVSLFFQEVQGLSAVQASLRFLPGLVVGFCLNIATGVLVHRVPAYYLVILTTLISAGSPLLMAFVNPTWPYWYAAFWSMILYPVSADVLFTVSSLIVVNVFPVETQALAGAVFNTVAQLGTSLGIATMAVVASNVTRKSNDPNKSSPAALLEGYRATFWLGFASMLLTSVIGVIGLRKAGKVGLKRD